MTKTIKILFLTLAIASISVVTFAACNPFESSSKPSKDKVVNHMVSLTADEEDSFMTDDQMREIYSCLMDEAYDDLSEETLNAMLKIKSIEDTSVDDKMTEKENKALEAAQEACSEKLAKLFESQLGEDGEFSDPTRSSDGM